MDKIITLNQDSMKAMETLANTNVEISKAKGILFDLKVEESTYLEEREQRVIKAIEKILEDSEGIIEKINGNHQEVTNFYNTVVSFVGFLSEMQEKLHVVIGDFNKNADQWEEKCKKEEERLATIARNLEAQSKGIAIDKKLIADGFKKLEEDKKLIESRQAQLASALQVIEKKKNG